jgi:hypothetical protein
LKTASAYLAALFLTSNVAHADPVYLSCAGTVAYLNAAKDQLEGHIEAVLITVDLAPVGTTRDRVNAATMRPARRGLRCGIRDTINSSPMPRPLRVVPRAVSSAHCDGNARRNLGPVVPRLISDHC